MVVRHLYFVKEKPGWLGWQGLFGTTLRWKTSASWGMNQSASSLVRRDGAGRGAGQSA